MVVANVCVRLVLLIFAEKQTIFLLIRVQNTSIKKYIAFHMGLVV